MSESEEQSRENMLAYLNQQQAENISTLTARLKKAEHLLNRWLALFELGGGPPERDSATVRETREFLGQ